MDAQFAVGKLICDHIILHIDNPNTQTHVIRMAEFVPWNGELKRVYFVAVEVNSSFRTPSMLGGDTHEIA